MAQNESPRRRSKRSFRIRWKWVLLAALVSAAGAAYWAFETPGGLFWRARSLEESDPKEAERLVIESVELAQGDYPDAQLFWCRLLIHSHRWTEALGCFDLIETPEACDQSELLDLGQKALAANQLLLAGNLLTAANRPGPGQPAVLKLLIDLKEGVGQTAEALELAKNLSQLSPGSSKAWQIQGRLYARQKELPEALKACEKALERNPAPEDEAAIRSTMVQVLIDQGDVQAARGQMNRLLAGDTPPSLRIQHAYLLRLESRLPEALDEIGRALEEDPSPRALMVRGLVLFDSGEFEKALADFRRITEAEPYNKEAHYKLAQSAERLGQADLAETHRAISRRLTAAAIELLEVEAALARDPQNRDRLGELADLYETLGQFPRGEQIRRHLRGLEQARSAN